MTQAHHPSWNPEAMPEGTTPASGPKPNQPRPQRWWLDLTYRTQIARPVNGAGLLVEERRSHQPIDYLAIVA